MKIKIEFEINVDMKKAIKEYSDENIKYFYNMSTNEHLQRMTEILKECFEEDCTDVKVNSLSVSKSEKEREIENDR